MRSWALLLGGLLVWAADFLALYAIASIWLTSPTARVLAGLVTIAALGADAWLLLAARARLTASEDDYRHWQARIAALAAAISALAVLWQGFPAIFG